LNRVKKQDYARNFVKRNHSQTAENSQWKRERKLSFQDLTLFSSILSKKLKSVKYFNVKKSIDII
jgi:hypothetical protein